MSPNSKPQPSEEERLMALLALDAQELPSRSAVDRMNLEKLDLAKLDGKSMTDEQIGQLHAYLDSHPEAFEDLLRRRSALATRNAPVPRSRRTWFASWQMPWPRYAVALGVSAACAILVSLVLIDSPDRMADDVERAYVELIEHSGAQSLAEVTSTQPQAEARLGFSGPARSTGTAATSFAAGLETGRNKLLQPGEPFPKPSIADENSFVLGQWNALLLTASQVPKPLAREFWSLQHERFQKFAGELAQQRRVDPVVIVHTQRVEALLAKLSERNGGRTAYELAQELLLFRARFAP